MDDIRIPNSLLPSNLMREAAKDIDNKFYPVLYKSLIKNGVSESRAVDILAAIMTEKVSLCIGEGLPEYDKRLLKNIIERHIAGIIRIE